MKIMQNRKGEARETHRKAPLSRWLTAPGLQLGNPNRGTAALSLWVSVPEGGITGAWLRQASPGSPSAHESRASPCQPRGAPPATSTSRRAPGLRSFLCLWEWLHNTQGALQTTGEAPNSHGQPRGDLGTQIPMPPERTALYCPTEVF